MTNDIMLRTDDIDSLKQIGQILAESGYFNSDNARASAAQLMVKVLAGRELGYGPWASAAGIHIIKGKMTVSANMMADAVKRSGRYDYFVNEMTDKKVTIEFFSVTDGKRKSLGVSEFTIEDGRKAGTQNLDRYPRNMLFARAMSNGVKWFTPDVFSGNVVYVPEELGEKVDEDGNVVDSTVTVVTQTNGGGTHAAVTTVADNQPSAEGAKRTENPNGNGGNGKVDTSTMFKRYAEAKEAARRSGKFNAEKHLENAWKGMFTQYNANKPENADVFLAAWTEYVADHAPVDAVIAELDAVTVEGVAEVAA